VQLPSADANPRSPQVLALRSHLLSQHWIDPTSSIQGLSSPGAGNMNHTLRVHLQGHSVPTLILKQSLPYVAKYPDIPAPVARDQSEAAFYQSISNNSELAERCPMLLGHDHANHLLCFEDLGTGLDFTHLYPQEMDTQNPAAPPNAPSELEAVLANLLGWLSQLHQQQPPTNFPSNIAMRELNHEHIFVLPFTANNGFTEPGQVASWQSELLKDTQVIQRIQVLGELYLGSTDTQLQASRALLHGDFYPGSWLQANTEPTQAHIIDPEFGFVGPAEFDLGVFSAHLTFTGWSTSAQQALLQTYQPPTNFNPILAAQYGAIEIMRRLLGVAKLPMQASAATQNAWLEGAAATVRNSLA
jgi:5-methylthioribose kinase